jgi:hypothetical protein
MLNELRVFVLALLDEPLESVFALLLSFIALYPLARVCGSRSVKELQAVSP